MSENQSIQRGPAPSSSEASPGAWKTSPGRAGLRGRLSSRCVLPGQESQVWLLLEAFSRREAAARSPLNLCLVLDRSFSMQEDHKIDRAREAALSLIESLRKSDAFSMVDFGTDVRVTIPAQIEVDVARARKAILNIRARSATNLFGGITAGLDELRKFGASGRLDRMLLLSDGVPTEGVTDDSQILGAARSARDRGISITTFGIGQDYDEILLSRISDATGGNHYAVETAAEVRSALARELQRIDTIVAQNLQLRLRAAENVKLILASSRYAGRAEEKAVEWRVSLDDLERGGSQPILFRAQLPPSNPGRSPIVTAILEYAPSGATSLDRLQQEASLRLEVEVTEAIDAIRAGIDRDVIRRAEEIQSVEEMAAVVQDSRLGLSATALTGRLFRTTRRLEELGSRRAALAAQIDQSLRERGGVDGDVARRTMIEKSSMHQQDHPEGPGESTRVQSSSPAS